MELIETRVMCLVVSRGAVNKRASLETGSAGLLMCNQTPVRTGESCYIFNISEELFAQGCFILSFYQLGLLSD